MKKILFSFLALSLFFSTQAQIHLSKLIIKSGETFSFGTSDILVADTLIMADSSGIILNRLKKENYLHAKVAVIGKNCFIAGNGVDGNDGKNGLSGNSVVGPCRSGVAGQNATAGTDGTKGVDLLIYFTTITFKGPLTINLMGGSGGLGGQGGQGGNGGNGTIHCAGGNGGNGGNGGKGGNAGDGGMLMIQAPAALKAILREMILVKNRGGQYGEGGRGGYSGSAGMAPTNKGRGVSGNEGTEGEDGLHGKDRGFSLTDKPEIKKAN